MRIRFQVREAVSGAALALLLPVLCAAQPAGAPSAGEVLDEVTVTARKQTERLIDVPLAITAFTQREIEAAGIRTLDDVAATTPGLTFSNVFGEFLPAPVIRGVAPTDINGENNTAIFVDGVLISGREGLNFSQLDLERIEVLKGPQAALYGHNAFSGAINYITARPADQLKGKAEVTLGNDNRRMGQMSVSGPLAGSLKGRLAALWDQRDGSYENQVSGGPNIGGYQFQTVQGSLYWTPSETFDALFSLYASDDHIDMPSTISVTPNCENRALIPVTPMLSSRNLNFCGEFPSVDDDSLSAIPGADGERREVERANLNLTWNLSGGTITALSGYSRVNQTFMMDGSHGSGANQLFIYQPTGPVITTIPGFGPVIPLAALRAGLLQPGPGTLNREFSQELRFSSPAERRFRFSVGGYYYDATLAGKGDGAVSVTPLPADFGAFCPCAQIIPPSPGLPLGAGVNLGFGNAAFLPWFTNPNGDSIDRVIIDNQTQSWAGFSWAEVDLAARWTARGELRYTAEEKTARDLLAGRRQNDTWDLVSWRTSIDFKPADNTTLYASVAKAQKSGGFDSASITLLQPAPLPPVAAIATVSFDPENLLAYELGMKGSWFAGRLRGDIALFYNDWTDIVIPQVFEEFDGQPVSIPFAISDNAGDATVTGVEFGLDLVFTEHLSAALRGSIQDAEFDRAMIASFDQYPSYFPDGDVSGNTVLRQSSGQGSVSLTYRDTIGAGFDWFVRSDASYQGKQYADASNEAILPERTLVNLKLGIERGNLSAELWARNLLNDDTPTGAFRDAYFTNATPEGTFGTGTFFPIRWTVTQPRLRQVGVTVRMRF